MTYPTKMEANGHIYPINTDYRYALACFRAINDPNITTLERYYAIQTILLGEDVIDGDEEILEKKIATYLRCGKEENTSIEEIDMDYFQDESLIRTSIRQVYHGLDVTKEHLHWWEYNELISGLTEECELNRVRDLRSYDLSQEKDEKRRRKISEAQQRVALKIDVPKIKEDKEIDEFWNSILK